MRDSALSSGMRSFPAKKKVYQDLRHYVMGDSIGTGNFTEVYDLLFSRLVRNGYSKNM